MKNVTGYSNALAREGYWYIADLADIHEPTFKSDMARVGMTKAFYSELLGCLLETADALNAAPSASNAPSRSPSRSPAARVETANLRTARYSPPTSEDAYSSHESCITDDEHSDSSSDYVSPEEAAKARRVAAGKTFQDSLQSRPNCRRVWRPFD